MFCQCFNELLSNIAAAVIKLSASTASPAGLSAQKAGLSIRDQVGCWRSGRPKSRNPGELSCPRCPHAEPLPVGSAGFLDFGLPGGCACSRLDYRLKAKISCRDHVDC